MKKLFITNLPAFYKINLFNELSEKLELSVIFTDLSSEERNSDFYHGERNFKHQTLVGIAWSKKLKIFYKIAVGGYDEIIIGGWDLPWFWLTWFLGRKRKNSLILESSYFESETGGAKGLVKRVFLSRISKVYCSGGAQINLSRALNFQGELIRTNGVGLHNFRHSRFKIINEDIYKKFGYVGRLAPEKNLVLLLEAFALRKGYKLDIAGFGPMESELKAAASPNIAFLGSVENKNLPLFFSRIDCLILPSNSEPWGLVVEEAISNGCPVIVSDVVGCAEDVVLKNNVGLTFKTNNLESLVAAMDTMLDVEFRKGILDNIRRLDCLENSSNYINSFI